MPHTYMRTSPGTSGTNACFVLPRLLWILSVLIVKRRGLVYNRP
jgi:hypothetical protein